MTFSVCPQIAQLLLLIGLFTPLVISNCSAAPVAKKNSVSAAQTLTNQRIDQLSEACEAAYKPFKTLRIEAEVITNSPDEHKENYLEKSIITFKRPNLWRHENLIAEKKTPSSVFVANGRDTFLVSPNDQYQRSEGTEYEKSVFNNIGVLSTLLSDDEEKAEEADANTDREYLTPRVVNGENLEGFRVRVLYKKPIEQVLEFTTWFDVKTHLLRRQQIVRSGPRMARSVTTWRITNHQANIEVSADAFAPPPPFHEDVEEAAAKDLLERAIHYYQGLQSIEAKFRQSDLSKTNKARDEKRNNTSHLRFRRPAFFRLDYDAEKRTSPRRIIVDGKSGFVDEGDVIYRQSSYKAADYIRDLNLFTRALPQGPAQEAIWQMMQGHNLLSLWRALRIYPPNALIYYSLHSMPASTHGTEKLEGIQFRLQADYYNHILEETTLWFDTRNAEQPILRRAEHRSDQDEPYLPQDLHFVEEVTLWKANPNLPEVLFRPAPGANVKNESQR
ncbi:MAG TPA: hypothetical protein VGB77_11455 [Abditibacteriaceae bacterium]|jgi:outer membrane lipoprotein-sorting protein